MRRYPFLPRPHPNPYVEARLKEADAARWVNSPSAIKRKLGNAGELAIIWGFVALLFFNIAVVLAVALAARAHAEELPNCRKEPCRVSVASQDGKLYDCGKIRIWKNPAGQKWAMIRIPCEATTPIATPSSDCCRAWGTGDWHCPCPYATPRPTPTPTATAPCPGGCLVPATDTTRCVRPCPK